MDAEAIKLIKKLLFTLNEIFKVHKVVLQGGKLDHNMVTKTSRMIDEATHATAAYLNMINPHEHTQQTQPEPLKEEEKLDFCDLFPTIKCGVGEQPENVVNPDDGEFL